MEGSRHIHMDIRATGGLIVFIAIIYHEFDPRALVDWKFIMKMARAQLALFVHPSKTSN